MAVVNKKEIGLLIAVVLKAEHLQDTHRFSKNDPFCVVSLTNSSAGRTKVDKGGGQHPVWDEEFRMPVYEVEGETQMLKVEVYQQDFKKEILIGSGNVPIDGKWKNNEFDDWIELVDERGKYAGEVFTEMTFYPIRPALPKPNASTIQRRPTKLDPSTRTQHAPLPQLPGRPGPSHGPQQHQAPLGRFTPANYRPPQQHTQPQYNNQSDNPPPRPGVSPAHGPEALAYALSQTNLSPTSPPPRTSSINPDAAQGRRPAPPPPQKRIPTSAPRPDPALAAATLDTGATRFGQLPFPGEEDLPALPAFLKPAEGRIEEARQRAEEERRRRVEEQERERVRVEEAERVRREESERRRQAEEEERRRAEAAAAEERHRVEEERRRVEQEQEAERRRQHEAQMAAQAEQAAQAARLAAEAQQRQSATPQPQPQPHHGYDQRPHHQQWSSQGSGYQPHAPGGYSDTSPASHIIGRQDSSPQPYAAPGEEPSELAYSSPPPHQGQPGPPYAKQYTSPGTPSLTPWAPLNLSRPQSGHVQQGSFSSAPTPGQYQQQHQHQQPYGQQPYPQQPQQGPYDPRFASTTAQQGSVHPRTSPSPHQQQPAYAPAPSPQPPLQQHYSPSHQVASPPHAGSPAPQTHFAGHPQRQSSEEYRRVSFGSQPQPLQAPFSPPPQHPGRIASGTSEDAGMPGAYRSHSSLSTHQPYSPPEEQRRQSASPAHPVVPPRPPKVPISVSSGSESRPVSPAVSPAPASPVSSAATVIPPRERTPLSTPPGPPSSSQMAAMEKLRARADPEVEADPVPEYTPGPSPPVASSSGKASGAALSNEKGEQAVRPSAFSASGSGIHAGQAALARRIEQERADAAMAAALAEEARAAEEAERQAKAERERKAEEEFAAWQAAERAREEEEEKQREAERREREQADEEMARMLSREAEEEERGVEERRRREEEDERLARELAGE